MQGGYWSYGLLLGLVIALLIAAWTDLRSRRITNALNIAIAAGAPLFWLTASYSWLDIGFQLAVAAITFVVLLALFAMKQMGGGDLKLLVALALWIQPVWFVKMLMVMAIVGALLTLIVWIDHRARNKPGHVAVPYGIAISLAGIFVIANQYLPIFQGTMLD